MLDFLVIIHIIWPSKLMKLCYLADARENHMAIESTIVLSIAMYESCAPALTCLILEQSCLIFGGCAIEAMFERLGIHVDCADAHRCVDDQSLEAVEGTRIDM
jgi:hypothetical protein